MEQLQNISYSSIYWQFLLPLIGAGADVLTGWIQASVNGSWDSTKMRKGLYRKGGEFVVVILAWVVEQAVPVVADFRFATCVSFYVVIMEVLSVIENLNQAGIPFPAFIQNKLGKLKEDIDNVRSDS